MHHIVYRGVDGHVQELFINQTGNWAVNTVSVAAGAPNATGVATGYVTGPRKEHGQSLLAGASAPAEETTQPALS